MEIATGFIDAFGEFDVDRAAGYLSDEAIVSAWGSDERFGLDLAWLRAIACREIGHSCEAFDDDSGAIDVRCTFEFHGLRSDDLGLGPFPDNDWHITVSNGELIFVRSDWNYEENDFSTQAWDPFLEWLSTTHPSDLGAMYEDNTYSSPLRSQPSIALWEERTHEYVDAVKRGDPT